MYYYPSNSAHRALSDVEAMEQLYPTSTSSINLTDQNSHDTAPMLAKATVPTQSLQVSSSFS